MNKNPDIPSHSYNQFVENIRNVHGQLPLSLDPQFPLVLTRFEAMNEIAQADYPIAMIATNYCTFPKVKEHIS